MKRTHGAQVIAVLVLVTIGLAVCALNSSAQILQEKEKDVQYIEWVRDSSAREVQRIAVLPPVVQLIFDVKGRIPDAPRFAVRRAVANEMPGLLKELIEKQGKSAIVGQASRALAETGLRSVDLFRCAAGFAEVLDDKHGNVCKLDLTRSALKENKLGLTAFHFAPVERLSQGTGYHGLAALSRDVKPQLNTEKLRQVASRLSTDALLLLRVENMDVVGTHLEGTKSVWITVHATLISCADGSPTLDASLKTNSYTREESDPTRRVSQRWVKSEHELALECMAKLTPVLVRRFIARNDATAAPSH